MKISTRQYAKRQISWIRNKLLPAISTANENKEDIVPFYLLDTSGKAKLFVNGIIFELFLSENDWSSEILKPATEIQDCNSCIITEIDHRIIPPLVFLAQEHLPDPKSLSGTASRLLNVGPKDIKWGVYVMP
jgi:tRNA dimethylallyltransferase